MGFFATDTERHTVAYLSGSVDRYLRRYWTTTYFILYGQARQGTQVELSQESD